MNITLNPKTVEKLRPHKMFFSIYNNQGVMISKDLVYELGKFPGVSFKKIGDVIVIYSDPEGFMVKTVQSRCYVYSSALVECMVKQFKLSVGFRYYVQQTENGLQVVSNVTTRQHRKRRTLQAA